MKLNNIRFLLLFVCSFFLYSCGDDDDNSGDGNPDNVISCCEIPHLEACAGGANIFVPNAFTPNANGVNDLFYPHGGTGVKEIKSFKIFDENNTIIYDVYNFQANDPIFGWDGELNDGTIVEAVYQYTLEVENVAGELFDFEGSVCVRPYVNPFPCVEFEKHCAFSAQHDGNGGFEPTLESFENCQ